MELTMNSIIKLILGLFVVVFVIAAFYLVLKNSIIDFFEGFTAGTPLELILSLL